MEDRFAVSHGTGLFKNDDCLVKFYSSSENRESSTIYIFPSIIAAALAPASPSYYKSTSRIEVMNALVDSCLAVTIADIDSIFTLWLCLFNFVESLFESLHDVLDHIHNAKV